jgi:hypothetical protein
VQLLLKLLSSKNAGTSGLLPEEYSASGAVFALGRIRDDILPLDFFKIVDFD